MRIRFDIPDVEKLPFVKICADKDFLIHNNYNGKCLRRISLEIPNKNSIYLLYNKNKELIYIGETDNLVKRLSSHRSEGRLDIFYVKFFINKFLRRERIAIEQILIVKYSPKSQEKTTKRQIPYT